MVKEIWIGYWVTDEDFDAQRDDGFYDSPADMAEPQAFALKSYKSINKLKAMAVAELQDITEQCDDKFEEGVWEIARKEKGYERWRYVCKHDTIHLIARRTKFI